MKGNLQGPDPATCETLQDYEPTMSMLLQLQQSGCMAVPVGDGPVKAPRLVNMWIVDKILKRMFWLH